MTKNSALRPRLRPIIIGGIIGIVGAVGFLSGALSSWSSRLSDRLFVPHQPDPSIAIVAIDDASLQKIGRWPWDRAVHAELIRRIANNGAVVIGYDVNFPEPQDAVNDMALAQAVQEAGNVILPVELTLQTAADGRVVSSGSALFAGEPIRSAAAGFGHTNVIPDADGVVRRLPMDIRSSIETISATQPAFAEVVASRAARMPSYLTIPQDRRGFLNVHYPGSPRDAFTPVPAADILAGTLPAGVFAGKIVLVGATAPDLHDEQLTPYGVMPGVEIHASFLDTLITSRWLRSVPVWMIAALLVVFGLLTGFNLAALRARWASVILVLVWAGFLVSAFVLFDRGWIVDLLWPTLVLAVAYALVGLERRMTAEYGRRELKQAFSRYVSPSIVDAILANPSSLKLGGTRRNMTVLFSDIRGFTSLSEGMRPEKLVGLLNTYLSRMTELVFAHGGVLDKYIGDAVMAFWNAPLDQPDHARRAVAAAIAMRDALEEMNEAKSFGKNELEIGIGIHTGDMVVGNVGGESRFDYTVIGDNVNLTSRLEGLTKEYGVSILISEATASEAGSELLTRKLDQVVVKGKTEPITIYEAMSLASRATQQQIDLARGYESALAHYLSREFVAAATCCSDLLSRHPADGPTQLLLSRCAEFIKHPPARDWGGAWVYTKK